MAKGIWIKVFDLVKLIHLQHSLLCTQKLLTVGIEQKDRNAGKKNNTLVMYWYFIVLSGL